MKKTFLFVNMLLVLFSHVSCKTGAPSRAPFAPANQLPDLDREYFVIVRVGGADSFGQSMMAIQRLTNLFDLQIDYDYSWPEVSAGKMIQFRWKGDIKVLQEKLNSIRQIAEIIIY